MYNALALFCILGIAGMFVWCIEETKSEITRRSNEKSEMRRASHRTDKREQEAYRKDYWIRRNRENMFDSEVVRSGK